jgi:SAM-dependent methyltransferase
MTQEVPESLSFLGEIMTRHGVKCRPEEFHAAVNETFHFHESQVYDQEHADMWNSLPPQVDQLAEDVLQGRTNLGAKLSLLDIGCGTGLAWSSLLRSRLGTRIANVDVLDSSAPMLEKSKARAASMNLNLTTFRGYIDSLPADKFYDIILTSSVLHHVPDLQSFLSQVRKHQAPSGIFIHLQDPNADYQDDPDLKGRMALTANQREPQEGFTSIPGRALTKLRRMLGIPSLLDYVRRTNDSLLKQGVIQNPMSAAEIYAITDIHVHEGGGISFSALSSWLADYDCISHRSYGFYGVLSSELDPSMQAKERELSASGALNGFFLCAAWRLKS